VIIEILFYTYFQYILAIAA